MTADEVEALIDGMVPALREHIAKELAPGQQHLATLAVICEQVPARLAELERRLRELEGKRG